VFSCKWAASGLQVWRRGFLTSPSITKSPTGKVGNFHFMNFSVPHSTPNQGLSATSQATRELGDSQKFLDNRDASRLSRQPKQLNLWESPQKPAAEASPYLQIKSVPVRERVNPKEIRYTLWIYPHAVRACGGQFTGHEAHQIAKATKGWNWLLDENNRLYCLPQLEALINSIIKRSVGGEA